MSGRMERQYYARRSAPIGPMFMRPIRRIRFGQRMKPKSWSNTMWFASALFERGNASRRRAFSRFMVKEPRP